MSTQAQTPATYLELISKDEKAVKIESLTYEAQKANLALSKEIMEFKSTIANKKSLLASAQRQIPYVVGTEYTIAKEIEILEAKLAFAEKIKAERFSDAQI